MADHIQRRGKIVCVDIDGVLATEQKPGSVYSGHYNVSGVPWQYCVPIDTGIELCDRLRQSGHTIILHTARLHEDRGVTMRWLVKHGVPFDGLVMGKPSAAIYIDDRGYRWQGTDGQRFEVLALLDGIEDDQTSMDSSQPPERIQLALLDGIEDDQTVP